MSNKITIEGFRQVGQQTPLLMDRPDHIFILNQHNKVISDYCDKVLPHLVDANGEIDKREALDKLATYANGVEIRKSYEHFKKVTFDEKEMKEIISILNKPLTELYRDYGQIILQVMFMKFEAYAKKNWNEQRYMKIYKSDSPMKWFRKIKEHPNVDNGKEMLTFHNYQQNRIKIENILNTKLRI